MRTFLTYAALFIVAVVMAQIFVFDSIRVSVYFSPLAYIAFVALLPVGARPVAVLLLGFATGLFVDFFEGTGGAHTAATLITAYLRRWMMILTMGRETVEEEKAMPSAKLLGGMKFLRYAALVAGFHCLVYFSLEALTWNNYGLVLVKSLVSGAFTLLAVWACSLLFTVKTPKIV
jgi:membrane-associated HD superfamily phosphohydrolase